MLSRLIKGTPRLMFVLPFNIGYDKPLTTTVDNEKRTGISHEIAMDRLKRMFSVDPDTGTVTKELQSIWSVTMFGTVTGIIIGGAMKTQEVAKEFIHNNKATLYYDARDARKAIQGSILINFIRNGIKMGCKLSLLCLYLGTFTTSISVYRGKYTVPNYVAGGVLTGLVYRLPMGPQAMIAAAGLGGTIGLIYGIVTVGMLKIAGITMDDLLEHEYSVAVTRHDTIRKNIYADEELLQFKQMYEDNKKITESLDKDAPKKQDKDK